MSDSHTSEIAQLRERIALEYQAAKNVFTGFTPTARHDFITKRQKNIEQYFTDLKQYMSSEEAMLLIMQVDNEVHGLPPSPRGRREDRQKLVCLLLRTQRHSQKRPL